MENDLFTNVIMLIAIVFLIYIIFSTMNFGYKKEGFDSSNNSTSTAKSSSSSNINGFAGNAQYYVSGIKDKVINVKSGEYGPYLQIISGKSKSNIPIPKSYKIEDLIDLTLLTKFEFDTWLSKSFKKNMEISIVAKKVSQKINISNTKVFNGLEIYYLDEYDMDFEEAKLFKPALVFPNEKTNLLTS